MTPWREEVAAYSSEEKPDEERLRAILSRVSTPTLEAIRVAVKTKRTTELIHTLTDAEHGFLLKMLTPDEDDAMFTVICAAGAVAVADEIDRRIPVPP